MKKTKKTAPRPMFARYLEGPKLEEVQGGYVDTRGDTCTLPERLCPKPVTSTYMVRCASAPDDMSNAAKFCKLLIDFDALNEVPEVRVSGRVVHEVHLKGREAPEGFYASNQNSIDRRRDVWNRAVDCESVAAARVRGASDWQERREGKGN